MDIKNSIYFFSKWKQWFEHKWKERVKFIFFLFKRKIKNADCLKIINGRNKIWVRLFGTCSKVGGISKPKTKKKFLYAFIIKTRKMFCCILFINWYINFVDYHYF